MEIHLDIKRMDELPQVLKSRGALSSKYTWKTSLQSRVYLQLQNIRSSLVSKPELNVILYRLFFFMRYMPITWQQSQPQIVLHDRVLRKEKRNIVLQKEEMLGWALLMLQTGTEDRVFS